MPLRNASEISDLNCLGILRGLHEYPENMKARSYVISIILGVALIPAFSMASITSVIVDSQSRGSSIVPVTFGQVFARGDVPAGMTVGAHVPLQVDIKSRFDDGSLKHAVLTALIRTAKDKGITLFSVESTPVEPAVQLSSLLATPFDAEIELKVDSILYRASAREMLENGRPSQWLSGPLVAEWLVGGPVKDPSNREYPHLAAYFHVRYYPDSGARVDVIVENAWTFVPAPNSFTYDWAIKINGREPVSGTKLTHYSHTRWHKRLWWGEGDPRVYTKLDTEYLQATQAVPNYADLRPSAFYLNEMLQTVEPTQPGDLRERWGDAGSHDQIAPLPRWIAAYILSGDQRAYNNMLANSDALGAYSLHYRDKRTGRPPTIIDYPTISITDPSSSDPRHRLPEDHGLSPFEHNRSHQPSLSYVPYLVTGDYVHLEALQLHANYNLIFAAPHKRNGSAGEFVRDIDYELRGKAWAMRTLGHAAYITPDEDPLKSYFVDRVNNNLKYIEAEYVNSPNWPGRTLGIMPQLNPQTFLNNSHWQQSFFAWSMGHLAELGFPAGSIRDWAAKFTSGLMGMDGGYCYQFATRNRTDFGPDASSAFQTFTALYHNYPAEQTKLACGSRALAEWMTASIRTEERKKFQSGEMLGLAQLPDSWYANFQPALAIAVDAGVAGCVHWQRFTVLNPVIPDYSDSPQWAIVPRRTNCIQLRSASREARNNTILRSPGK